MRGRHSFSSSSDTTQSWIEDYVELNPRTLSMSDRNSTMLLLEVQVLPTIKWKYFITDLNRDHLYSLLFSFSESSFSLSSILTPPPPTPTPAPHLFCLNIFLQALFTNSSIDERVEPVEEEEEEEDHTYELLLTAQTKVPSLKQDFQSNKGKY